MKRPAIGTKIRVRNGPYDDDPWVCATVRQHLSAQFTADTHGGRTVFGLYSGEGGSWKLGW